jgi:hypothetical protein
MYRARNRSRTTKLARYVPGETVRLMSERETLLLTVRKEGMGAVVGRSSSSSPAPM